ncbi:hypothetical protein METSCH_D05060 [Metschnikowia aff. pulcherrima]|uniref:Uncharacterized protein n=1 Tax=Metschnikowia aff. pulcherrima TaxID=2163413 RepID=A0A4P6XU61_9ASCO|nr:hypothetical protein METSCH_D05060 [Metschnikowia aff. pulcherrima]
MLSSQQSYKQAILEAAQTSDKVSILGRIYYWLFPHKYAKSLFGNKCDKTVLQKLKSQSSTRIMKVVYYSSVILLLFLAAGLAIGALVIEDPGIYIYMAMSSFGILWSLTAHSAAFLSSSECEEDPLDIETSLSSFICIEDIWSQRLWSFAPLPITAFALASWYLFVIV